MLEELHGTVLLEHGFSISILSEISPAIYFVTLLTILLLSSANQVSWAVASLQRYVMQSCQSCYSGDINVCGYSLELFVRKLLYFIIFLVYAVGILNGFSSSPLMQKTSWFDINVYFNILPHMPSIFISIASILLYSYHFYNVNYHQQPWIGDNMDENNDDKTSSGADKTNVPTAWTNLTPSDVQQPDEMSGDEENGPVKKSMARYASCLSCDVMTPYEYIRSTSNFVKNLKFGPPASEASILGAFTAFLGGIGAIGMLRGSIQEVQLQLVIAVLFSFAVLEIATQKLNSFFTYFLHVTDFKKVSDDENSEMQDIEKNFFMGILFIRFVTLLLQFFIIIVYADIRNDLKLEYSALSEIVLVLIAFFFAMKLVACGNRIMGRCFF